MIQCEERIHIAIRKDKGTQGAIAIARKIQRILVIETFCGKKKHCPTSIARTQTLQKRPDLIQVLRCSTFVLIQIVILEEELRI